MVSREIVSVGHWKLDREIPRPPERICSRQLSSACGLDIDIALGLCTIRISRKEEMHHRIVSFFVEHSAQLDVFFKVGPLGASLRCFLDPRGISWSRSRACSLLCTLSMGCRCCREVGLRRKGKHGRSVGRIEASCGLARARCHFHTRADFLQVRKLMH